MSVVALRVLGHACRPIERRNRARAPWAIRSIDGEETHRLSVCVPVMNVGEVRVLVGYRRMAVQMAVRLPVVPREGMIVLVVRVVLVGVTGLHRLVQMDVLVLLGEM